MKYLVISFIAMFFSFSNYAQNNDSLVSASVKDVTLESLKSPTNPAFIMMNTTPTEIVEPGSAPEFFTSVQAASNSFTAFPTNYGFSVTPYWWKDGAKNLSFVKDYDTAKNSFSFYRTLSISGGMVQIIDDQNNEWRYGLGFQSTLLRGKVDAGKREAYLEQLIAYNRAYYGDIYSFFESDSTYKVFYPESLKIPDSIKNMNILIDSLEQLKEKTISGVTRDSLQAVIDNLKKELEALYDYEDKFSNDFNVLKSKLSKQYKTKKSKEPKGDKVLQSSKELDRKFNEMNERKGLKWDIGAGFSINSINNKLDSTGLYRAGLWTNIGGNFVTSSKTSSNLAGFALVRYLYYDEVKYFHDDTSDLLKDLQTLDFGGKLQYEIIGKFVISAELVYRTDIGNSIYQNTYKLNGLAQYNFGSNKMVYVSVGNDFNDNSNEGPTELKIILGLNIGFGGNIELYDTKVQY